MGNKWNKSIIKKDVVEENINKANNITRKYKVIEFIGLYLKFFLDEDGFSSKNFIKVEVKKFNERTGKVEDEPRKIYLSIEQFYNYYSAIVNYLSMIYSKKLEERLSQLSDKADKSFGEDESSFCPICEDQKVDISLPCSHFFCEKCINNWIIKSDTCPLCRIKLEKSTGTTPDMTPQIIGAERWSVLSKDENLDQEVKKDNIDILLKLTNELFIKK